MSALLEFLKGNLNNKTQEDYQKLKKIKRVKGRDHSFSFDDFREISMLEIDIRNMEKINPKNYCDGLIVVDGERKEKKMLVIMHVVRGLILNNEEFDNFESALP